MTVKELIEILSKKNGDLDVFAIADGIAYRLTEDSVYLGTLTPFRDAPLVLILSGDD